VARSLRTCWFENLLVLQKSALPYTGNNSIAPQFDITIRIRGVP